MFLFLKLFTFFDMFFTVLVFILLIYGIFFYFIPFEISYEYFSPFVTWLLTLFMVFLNYLYYI